ncbi:MAG: MerR family transcriptional regulator [Clostridia bacterium]|nr:MerR family transcriptional regulator [Clostridia bacterium]
MIRIGDFSKLSRISIRMLRHYDDLGLLKPETVDGVTGYRYYSPAQLQNANRVTALKDMGFSLASIAEIMKQYHDPVALRAFLAVKSEEVKEQERDARNRLMLIETAMKRLRKDIHSMKYDVTQKTMPQRYVASLRKKIPTYQDEHTLWEQMGQEAGCALQTDNPCYSLAVFFDEGYKESDVDVEIQIAVQGRYEDTENVIFKTVGPIDIASAIYKGSYEQIYEVNEAVAAWVSDNGYDYNGPMFNIYHVSPGHDPNPENWVTEVCYPIKKRQ